MGRVVVRCWVGLGELMMRGVMDDVYPSRHPGYSSFRAVTRIHISSLRPGYIPYIQLGIHLVVTFS